MESVLRAEDPSEDRSLHPSTTSVGPLVAVRGLHWACRRMITLSEHTPSDPAQTFHRVVSVIHDICKSLSECELAGIDGAELRRIVAPAREIHGRSPFIRRLQTWPRGYPGDFETIEWLYRGENRAAAGPLARALESYALTASIAQQHRNKVMFQAACVLEALERHPHARILSVACGSSPDVRSISAHVKPTASLVLVDSDPDALNFSAGQLQPIADRCRFVPGMVPRVLRRLREDGPYDLIFAGGLFDYLPDRLIATTLSMTWKSLLAPGGRMVFTNIACGNPFRVWLEYLADWRLIERSAADVERLCGMAEIPVRPSITRESTGLAMLVSLRKA